MRIPKGRVLPNALLVPDRAVQADQGGRYLLVVSKDNIVEQRYVELGELSGELRVITSGLNSGDRVVIVNLVNELARLPGVGNVKVFGAAQYAMRIWIDPQKLYTFGLVPDDVIKAVKQQSQVVAAGQTGMSPAPTNQDFQYTLDDPGQFADIVVKGQTAQGGRLVQVKDMHRTRLTDIFAAMLARWAASPGHRHLSDP